MSDPAPPATSPHLAAQRPYLTSSRGGIGSYVGVYPPFAYVPLGVGAWLGTSADASMYAGRIAGAGICFLLLGIAVYFCGAGWERVGLLAAASPMVLFLAGSLNPSGIEVSAGIAQAAVVLALARGDRRRVVWVAYGLSGVALVLARQFGPVWVVFDALVLLALVGRRQGRDMVRKGASLSVMAAALVVIGAAAILAWDVFVMPSETPPLSKITQGIPDLVHAIQPNAKQLYGVFGWLDTSPPPVATDLALLVYLVLVVAGLVLGTRRHRLVIVVATVVMLAFSSVVDLVTQIPYGLGLQARYVMPMTAMIFLLSGFVIEQRSPLRRRRFVELAAPAMCSVLAVLLAAGWYASSRRSADGQGALLFFSHSTWSPPAGWPLWLTITAMATICVVYGVVGRQQPLGRRRGGLRSQPAMASANDHP